MTDVPKVIKCCTTWQTATVESHKNCAVYLVIYCRSMSLLVKIICENLSL